MTALEVLRKRYRSGGKLNDAEKLVVDVYMLSRNNGTFSDADLERAADKLARLESALAAAKELIDECGWLLPGLIENNDYEIKGYLLDGLAVALAAVTGEEAG